jgi:hypothetical protein
MEKAAATRGLSAFPPGWGIYRGRPDSEERARWVKEKVTEHLALQRIWRRAAVEAKPQASGLNGFIRSDSIGITEY